MLSVPNTKDLMSYDSLYINSRKGKAIETENRSVAAWAVSVRALIGVMRMF